MKTYTWVTYAWVFLVSVIIAYLGMGIYQIGIDDNIVFANPKVATAKEKMEKVNWVELCPINTEKDKKSFFDCSGNAVEEQTKELKDDIVSFGEKTSGVFIFKVNTHISEETWNRQKIIIDIKGVDIFWIFRDPPTSTSPKPRAPSATASFFIPHEIKSTPKLLLFPPLLKFSPPPAK